MLKAMRNKSILLVIALVTVSVAAQQPKPLAVSLGQPVPNDDRGQAFILERDLAPLSHLPGPRKGTISEPQQYSIFAGSNWANSALAERETKLAHLLMNVTDDGELSALQDAGIKNRFGFTINVERPDLTNQNLSDLDLQRMLASMLAEGSLPKPNHATIYVVFLDASLRSTLGELAAGKHYAAYYGAFNTGGANVRYVVVPWESDAAAGYHIALRAFVGAALKRATALAK